MPSKTIDQLKAAVQNAVAPSCCHGTLPLEASCGSVFFKKDEESEARFINFAKKSVADEEILRLVEVSQRATFGRNDQDVLDESYRKAWKLDVSQISAQFDVVSSGIIETVQNQLLHYENSTMTLEPHLYKLNVYGPGSFFKPHVDTPRSDKLFATLVVVLPTVHTGGNLLLGEKGAFLNFDSSALLYDVATEEPQIAFAAFYSDVVHEVLPVKSGYRVTLTYNLHLSQETPESQSIPRAPATESYNSLVNSLRELVIASDVLEKDIGGDALGFGLMSRYPIAVQKGQANLQQFTGALKGGDAMIRTACQELGFKVSVKVLYKTSDYSPHRWLADTMLSDWDLGDCEDDLVDRIRNAATLIKSRAPGDDDEDEDEDVDEDEDRSDDEDSVGGGGRGIGLIWVTKPSHMVRTDLAYLSFGNEPSMGYVYGELVLIATPTKHTKARMAGERVSVTPPPAKGMTKELKAALDVMHKAFTDAMNKQKEAEEAKKKAEFDGSTYDFDNLEQLSKEPRKMLFKLAAYCKVSGAGTNQAILDRIIESRKNDSGSD